MAARIFLGLSALLWLPYGIACFLNPGSLALGAGVAASSATGSTELRAMYGGLQAAIGLLAGAGALRPALARHALVTLAFVCGGLGVARLGGAALDGGFTQYTGMALGLEFGTLALTGWLLSRSPGVAARS